MQLGFALGISRELLDFSRVFPNIKITEISLEFRCMSCFFGLKESFEGHSHPFRYWFNRLQAASDNEFPPSTHPNPAKADATHPNATRSVSGGV